MTAPRRPKHRKPSTGKRKPPNVTLANAVAWQAPAPGTNNPSAQDAASKPTEKGTK